MYKQGLKPRLREELLYIGATIKTLEDYYNKTIRIDNKFFSLAIELKEYYCYAGYLPKQISRGTGLFCEEKR